MKNNSRNSNCLSVSDLNRIIEITTQILKGLEDIHKTGLIHRDLKPDNVMIMDERIVIMDLGVIKDFNASTSITGGKFLVTIKYTAPEYLLNGISYTFRNISRLSKCSKLLDAYCSYYSFLFLRFS